MAVPLKRPVAPRQLSGRQESGDDTVRTANSDTAHSSHGKGGQRVSHRRLTGRVCGLGPALALILGFVLPALPASAVSIDQGQFINRAHGLCLTAAAAHDGSNGDAVRLWHCYGGRNQWWFENTNGTITNGAHGLCLTAAAAHDGSDRDPVRLWSCYGGSNQKWSLVRSWTWANGAHGLILDAKKGGDGTNGDLVELFTWTGGLNQQWNAFV